MPSAGILAPVMRRGGEHGNDSSFQPRNDQIKAKIVLGGHRIEVHIES